MMKKKLLIYTLLFAALALITACSGKTKDKETPAPSITPGSTKTAAPTKTPSETPAPSAAPSETSAAASTEDASGSTPQPPVFIQKEGEISLEDAVNFLRTYLGSSDENGYAFSFDYERTLQKDGRDFYQFRISSMIPDASGALQPVVYGTYLISADGEDIEEYHG